jgi:hypothetical protein
MAVEAREHATRKHSMANAMQLAALLDGLSA